MKKILIPTDLSVQANFAYDLANKIANRTNSEIHLLSVVSATPDIFFDKNGNIKEELGKDYSELHAMENKLKEELKDWLKNKKNITTTKVKIGRVEEDVLRYISDNQIDLVVMGTEGAYGVEEILKSSHTANIAMSSPVPVLSLKCDRSDMEIEDILLVSDFHPPKELNLKIVQTLQSAFSAKLHLLKVNTPKDFETTQTVQLHMKEFSELNCLENVEFHVYCDNTVEEGIVNFSEDTGIDFITMATHQRSGLSRLFKKSISSAVINHLWQPILTFPIS